MAEASEELPEIPSAGDPFIDAQIKHVLAAVQGLARLYAHALKLKGEEIVTLKKRIEELEEAQGEFEEKLLDELATQGKKVWDGIEPAVGNVGALAYRVQDFLGHETVDDTIEVYELRRAAEDAIDEAAAAFKVLEEIPIP